MRNAIQYLYAVRYLHYFLVGMSGVALNLAITIGLTEFVFGRENYFSAYMFGLAAGLLYSFGLHTMVTFRTTQNHGRRLTLFVSYSLCLAYVQASVVRWATDWVGVDWYAAVIAAVIMIFSIMTFLIFKFFLFKEDSSHVAQQTDITTR